MNAAISLVKPYMLVLVNIFSGTVQRSVSQCLLGSLRISENQLEILLFYTFCTFFLKFSV